MSLFLKTPKNKVTKEKCSHCHFSYPEELQSKQKELLEYKSKLGQVNNELLETNRAVSILARNIDKSRNETRYSVIKAINTQLIPIIEDLRKAKNLENVHAHLDILVANLQSLSSDLAGGSNFMIALTPSELRVATMIKNGLTSQKIADKLCISSLTVKTHRRNIRKKLDLKNSRINLASYLQSIMW
jgi:DNA-binding CsgD family transcriptional regulator